MITAFLNVLWYYIDYVGEPSVKNGSLSLCSLVFYKSPCGKCRLMSSFNMF